MPDILASAQTQIDDAAQQIGAPTGTSSPTPSPPPDPVLSNLNLPYSSRGHDLPPEPEPTPVIPPSVPTKHNSKSLVLAVILFLVATLPLAVYFTSQQRQLADLRGRAQEGPYDRGCTPASVSPLDTGGRSCCDGTTLQNGVCTTTTTTTGRGCTPAGVSPLDTGGRICCTGTSLQGGICTTTTPTITRGTTPTITTTVTPGSCGNAGQACCPSNRTDGGNICNGNLYCNGSTCQSTAPANLCQGLQGSQSTAGTKCKIYRCGSRCNNGNQCNLGESIVDCGTSLGECGQIDWLDTNNNYCGVKEQNCGGSCAGTTTTTTGGTTTTTSGGTTTTTNNPTATPIPTPTPTPVPGGTCELIKLYDAAGTEITQAVKDGTKKLALGEQVIIATSKGNATKSRFRIQGIADWTENDPAKTTAAEYRLSITIPSTLTQAQGTFEVEVFVNGVWK